MSDGGNPRFAGLCHIGIHSKDPAALAEFYRDVLGMQVVGGSGSDNPFGASTFLSSRPDQESHEIVIFADAACATPRSGSRRSRICARATARSSRAAADQDGAQSRRVARLLLRRSRGQHDRDLLGDRVWPTASPTAIRSISRCPRRRCCATSSSSRRARGSRGSLAIRRRRTPARCSTTQWTC